MRRKTFTGYHVSATYRRQQLPEYRGNPLIEALPPIMHGGAKAYRALFNDIVHGKRCRKADAHLRRHMIQRLRQFWYPQPETLELEHHISTLIRGGYVHRNPTDVAGWCARLAAARERLGKGATEDEPSVETSSWEGTKTSAHSIGMSVAGLSGVGKTTSIQRVLSTYPQRIIHDSPDRRHPVVDQLVWLLVTCPEDGGTPALCRAILAAFDKVRGTSWARYFTERGSSAHAMRTAVVSLAHSHALGLLVIDEIQLLKSSRTGNARTILGFLLALMNDLDVPVLLVGTQEATGVLNPKMQNARRFVGNPTIIMDRLEHRADGQVGGEGQKTSPFEDFVGLLWDRSFLRDMKPFHELGKEKAVILDTLYRCTAGVHDLVVKMILFGQGLALSTGEEDLTPAMFEHVYETDFILLHDCLERLHAGAPVDQEAWTRSINSLRAEELPDPAAAALANAVLAGMGQRTDRKASKSVGNKGKGRGTPKGGVLSEDQLAAGLEDARRLLGHGVLGGSLLLGSGDVVR